MKTKSEVEMTLIPKNLHRLVGLAAGNSMPMAVQRNSFIVNEVPRDFQIANNEHLLAAALDSLLSTVVRNSKHSCIRVKAREYDDIIFVSVRDNNSPDAYAVNGNLEEVKVLVQAMNGSVSVENNGDEFTTILLSFPNFPKAA
ncbi:MAG: hypothetical protein ABIQ31_06170 [Ferruginibacter sp.]